MKKNIAWGIITLSGLCLLIFASFSGSKNFQNDLTKKLVGEWRNVYVKIVIKNAKTGSVATMEADSANWEKRLGIQPIRTHFKSDGSYYSEYRSLKDSVIKRNDGTWFIKGDSLTMAQTSPSKSVLKLHISIKNDHASFHGMIDFDGSGKLDDEYFGVQKKYNDK